MVGRSVDLQVLHFSANSDVGPTGFAALADALRGQTTLRELFVDSLNAGDEGIQVL